LFVDKIFKKLGYIFRYNSACWIAGVAVVLRHRN